MKKRIPLSLTVALIIITACITVSATLLILILTGRLSSSDNLWYNKLNEIQNLVDGSFYGEVDPEYIADCAADGMVAGLDDKYADYLSVEESEENKLSNSGEKIGIGISAVVLKSENRIYVYRTDNGGPAEEAGVQVGDYIIAVDGVDIAETGVQTAYENLNGEEGTSVNITVDRAGETLIFTVIRREFDITTVYSHMIGTKGYICITRFNSTTPKQFKTAVTELQSKGTDGLIFDLRSCGGGIVDPTAEILDYLLPDGNIISAIYADGTSKVMFTSDKNSVDLPMCVLTTGSTASAAELFSAAIRDYGKGALIGSNTYGKGVMQRTFYLSDGSAVRFTIAEFAPPGGVCFNGKGLEPDIYAEYTNEQKQTYYLLNDSEDPFIISALDYLSGVGADKQEQ